MTDRETIKLQDFHQIFVQGKTETSIKESHVHSDLIVLRKTNYLFRPRYSESISSGNLRLRSRVKTLDSETEFRKVKTSSGIITGSSKYRSITSARSRKESEAMIALAFSL